MQTPQIMTLNTDNLSKNLIQRPTDIIVLVNCWHAWLVHHNAALNIRPQACVPMKQLRNQWLMYVACPKATPMNGWLNYSWC